MYIYLEYYSPYKDVLLDIFGTKINSNLRCCHGYPCPSMKYNMITWINKKPGNI